jgi:BlaI family transcriptional regulator, penicillinase repressor
MARKARSTPFNRPSDAEMDILNLLWDRGPSTVRQVHDELEKTKPSRYTSTLKIMQILVDKSLLERETVDGSHVYRPRIAREATQREMAGHLMNRAFGGSVYQLLVGALSVDRASDEELNELSRLIRKHQKERKK